MSDVMIPKFTQGERMTKAREAAGIRRPADMASILKVTDKTIRNWESGKTRVSESALIAYGSATGVPVWWLKGGGEPLPERSSALFGDNASSVIAA